jgi:hypothetical protein
MIASRSPNLGSRPCVENLRGYVTPSSDVLPIPRELNAVHNTAGFMGLVLQYLLGRDKRAVPIVDQRMYQLDAQRILHLRIANRKPIAMPFLELYRDLLWVG